MAKAISVKSSSDRKKHPLNCGLSHLDTPQTLADDPSSLQLMLSVCCISSKISHSCRVQGRRTPLRGLRIVLRQLIKIILTYVVNF